MITTRDKHYLTPKCTEVLCRCVIDLSRITSERESTEKVDNRISVIHATGIYTLSSTTFSQIHYAACSTINDASPSRKKFGRVDKTARCGAEKKDRPSPIFRRPDLLRAKKRTDQPVRRMRWTPLCVSTTSLISPTRSENAASSKGFCICP